MTETLVYSGQLTIVVCWCGMRHAVPDELRKAQLADSRKVVYCPLGHEYVHRKSDAQVEREKREAVERQLAAERDTSRRWRQRADQERRSAIAYKGHLTRMRNRIVAGVCPVPGCKRSGFAQVMRHIATQHPDWLADHPEVHGDA